MKTSLALAAATVAVTIWAGVLDRAPRRDWYTRYAAIAERLGIEPGAGAEMLDLLGEMRTTLAAVGLETASEDLRASFVTTLAVTFLHGLQRDLQARSPESVRADVDRGMEIIELSRSPETAATWVSRHEYLVWTYANHLQLCGRVAESVELLEEFERRRPDAGYVASGRLVLLAQGLRDSAGRLGDALALIERGLERFGSDPATAAELLSVRAAVYLDLGLVQEALADLAVVERVGTELDLGHLRFRALCGFADIELARADFGAVERRVESALSEEWPADLSAILRIYLGVSRADDDPVSAFETLRAALEDPALPATYLPTASVHLVGAALAANRFDDVAHAVEIVREEVEKTAPGGRPSPINSIWTEILLGQGAGREELLRQLPRQIAEFEDLLATWRSAPALPAGTSFLQFEHRRRVLRDLLRLRMAIDPGEVGVEAAVGDLMRAQAMSTLAVHIGAEPVTIADIREHLLEPDSGILVYLPTPFGSQVFAIDHDGVRAFELGPDMAVRAPIQKLVESLWRDVEDADAATRARWAQRIADRSRAVAEMVLPAEVEHVVLGWTGGATIVGAGLWWNLPFESLVLSDGDRLLGEAVAVDTLGSLPFGVARARAMAGAVPAEVLDVALLATLDPRNADVRAAPTRFREVDARDLLGEEAAQRATIALEEDCTPDAFFAAIAAGTHRVVHVVAHGVPDAERTSFGLGLREQSVWSTKVRERSAGGLVFLSACGVGAGTLRRGDDDLVDTFGGALLYAGAHTVVLSRTDIVFGPHMDLCRVFHRELRRGASPARAMKLARIAATANADLLEKFVQSRIQVVGLGQKPLFR